MGRFINADDTSYLGADGSPISFNLFTYCKNNPVAYIDPAGNFGLLTAIIVTGGIVGGLLGVFSATATGGNIVEGAIEGVITGVIGSSCGALVANPFLAVTLSYAGAFVADVATQAVGQYIETKEVNKSKIDLNRSKKTATTTCLGTAIPAFGKYRVDLVDAVATAIIWAEGSTLITCADVVITNIATSDSEPTLATWIFDITERIFSELG
jgi:hypothetical protein